VYTNWDERVHVIDPFEIPETWSRFWGIDFGYRNPMVVGMWAQDPKTGRLYCYREFYRSQTLVEHFADWVLDTVAPMYWTCTNGHENLTHKFAAEEETCSDCKLWRTLEQRGVRQWNEPKPRKILVDHDAEDYMTWQLHTGLRTTPAHKDVLEGVQAVEERLALRDDGKPGLMYFRGCNVGRPDPEMMEQGKPTSTIQEFPGYVWAPPPQTNTISPTMDRTRELPGKDNDHGLDQTRYIVANFDMKRKTQIRVAS
jgi:phage terminase large subunit